MLSPDGPQTSFGVDQFTDLKTSAIGASLVVVAACVFRESKVDLQLRASRDDPVSAGAMVRWIALVLSAFIAGLGGGLFAHVITSFTPKALFLTETSVILAMLVIGGPATVNWRRRGNIDRDTNFIKGCVGLRTQST